MRREMYVDRGGTRGAVPGGIPGPMLQVSRAPRGEVNPLGPLLGEPREARFSRHRAFCATIRAWRTTSMRKPLECVPRTPACVPLLLAASFGVPSVAAAGDVVVGQVWRSSPANATLALAFGDLNRDGYLDLVSGNIDQPVFIHFGRPDSLLGAIPALTDSSRFTTSVALGDVDGDGDLDLVCGNLSQPNNLYRNDGGVFRWAWEAQVSDVTRSVALADVDDDGRLDLVCGNEGAANTVYLNRGVDFDVLPACSVGIGTDTRAVAVGDLDGDDRLDLFFGNAAGGVVRVPEPGRDVRRLPGLLGCGGSRHARRRAGRRERGRRAGPRLRKPRRALDAPPERRQRHVRRSAVVDIGVARRERRCARRPGSGRTPGSGAGKRGRGQRRVPQRGRLAVRVRAGGLDRGSGRCHARRGPGRPGR